ncbi:MULTISPECIES: S8 family serine peptidase [Methylobacterium]|uniref:P/Homo B domain-containing protein n=6 Tax=Pseudomonadota TaxID=1224 RepID=A0ABQ4SUX9_9HYPH|nr:MULTISPECIES: S8 family serine peptidase [Methylobacterium]PIU07869.1 MAG: hypothetical protein COT56_03720 [Methylobacterium sp. CG09_land_8_20_14_0_10_71_15]PIU11068.1 MAG: hypothetical protein COT28_22015 [Methylobacterium sp. CG08_land_8_20_14_0_20_71_15]GBU18698.1 hypothetical protein AwMethylo_29130 [Methylobacterium sp.]GJE05663.1 hypothetical protein AOPFMNJM_0967 [Methylobacterium jeotgali]
MASNYIPTDPLFDAQWHLRNTGQDIMGLPQASGTYRNDINVTGVWPDYTGKGVVVGVFDDGFQTQHPDLAPNLLLNKFYDLRTHRPGTTDGSHGTATMGLIVAAQNGQGVVGVAYGAKGIGYTSLGPTDTENYIEAAPRALMDGVDVLNNSWGFTNTGNDPFGLRDQQKFFAGAHISLVELGRNGLGTVSMFSAGNDREKFANTLYSPLTNSPYVTVVAAANADGTVSSYSTPGPNVLVAAPGSGNGLYTGRANEVPSIVTTDLLGTAGSNKFKDGDYTNVLDPQPAIERASYGFNGTSAAAPIATGVVALMLEANPSLGYRDVQEILAYSARTPAGVTTWNTNGATDWNGGGHLFNSDLGFGHVDALAAVRLAETWGKQSTFQNLARESALLTAPGGSTVNANDTVKFTASFQEPLRVQHVSVTVEMGRDNYPMDFGELTLSLIGPGGHTATTLMAPTANFSAIPGTRFSYTFDSVQNWGELSTAGPWTLSVTNGSGTQPVDILASITLLGDSVTAGQTFVYTDDYARLGASDASRAVLSAPSVGPHTLNAAAVTGDTVVDLTKHAASIAGVDIRIGDSMKFASLITGDGNDTLVGDASDQIFIAGRGINTITGGGGSDTLHLLRGIADYSLLAAGTTSVLAGSESRDSFTGIAKLQFADGALTLGSNPLVDDVYYARTYADVYAAGAGADAHYADYGWHEGRNPNAFFDTRAYLAAYGDVKAANVDPLTHYDAQGWREGRDPSASFDTSLYLARNADVAAAGVDPLLHYLEYGQAEGRKAIPVVDGAHLSNGFDATFYRLANPDVAAAGVDPLTHWQQHGEAEGRNPNAFFDTRYYLSHNADVAAAGVDPLVHYLQHGWQEGRDPSSHFNTSAYLAQYTDVAAAGADPLLHFLEYGIREGRSGFGDLI